MQAGQMLLPITDVQLGQWPIIIVESKKMLWAKSSRIDLEKDNVISLCFKTTSLQQ